MTAKEYLSRANRVAVLLHEGCAGTGGKTGLSYLRYGGAEVVAVIDSESAGKTLYEATGIDRDIPVVADLKSALGYSPDGLLIGIAPSGGILPESWLSEIEAAVRAGLSIVNGLHSPLAPVFPALKPGQWIWDIRREPAGLRVGKARALELSCPRILTVGTDMSVGKMSTALELHRAAGAAGAKSKFIATGQGGIMIAGEGIPLDAIRVDYAAGAVEGEVLGAADRDIIFIEGQGSLLHPGSTATLPLIRGGQPTALILVHRAGQVHVKDLPGVPIPPLRDVIELYESVARAGGAFPGARVRGVALNTFALDPGSAANEIARVREETGLYCTDPVRFGGGELYELCK